jgi:hypothetical protein
MKAIQYNLALLCLLLGLAPQTGTAQIDRSQFTVVTAAELAENPQRYWSRGVVFEDVIEQDTGRTRRINDRSFFEIETRDFGRVWVDMTLADKRDALMIAGQACVFAGTVLNEITRSATFRRTTTYYVAIDFVEPLNDAAVEPLQVMELASDNPERAAHHVQTAVRTVQGRLLAHAQSEGVDIVTLFEANHPSPDKATELAQIAIRELELDTGLSSGYWLTQLVRDIVAQQYVDQTPGESAITPPAQVEEPTPSSTE